LDHFIGIVSGEMRLPVKKAEPEAIAALEAINWTGNIRELRNVVERLMIFSGESITLKDVERYVLPSAAGESQPLKSLFRQFDDLESLQQYIAREYEAFRKA
ncbi:hypothetical protein RZS08_15750, partial [Arthrospira platensis SPKY1]|nr:hypothetical protein [Arthrospira platensis SPKY1]